MLSMVLLRLLRQLPVWLALLSCVACEPQAAPELVATQVRDSVGTRIVEYRAGLPDVSRWSIAESPTVTIGALDGAAPELLSQVADVAELSDRSIIVAEARAREVRAFDHTGGHLWTAGGPGGGPGEFSSSLLRLAIMPGDTIAVRDGRSVNLFDSSGRFVRRIALVSPSEEFGSPSLLGAFDDGRLVGQARRSAPVEFGRSRGTVAVILYDGSGGVSRVLAEVPGTEGVRIPDDPAPGLVMQGDAVWGRRTEVAVGRRNITLTTQQVFEILRFGPDASRQVVLRVLQPPMLADERVRSRLGLVGESVHLPDTLPAVGALRLDAEDRIWIQEYRPPYEARDHSTWWVFEDTGELRAQVRVPESFDLIEIKGAYVIGVTRDSLGVQYVEVRHIIR